MLPLLPRAVDPGQVGDIEIDRRDQERGVADAHVRVRAVRGAVRQGGLRAGLRHAADERQVVEDGVLEADDDAPAREAAGSGVRRVLGVGGGGEGEKEEGDERRSAAHPGDPTPAYRDPR